MKLKKNTIDATGRSLGRVASDAAVILMGKDSPSYARNVQPENTVTIENASKMVITAKKKKEKIYTRYSGYPGGLKKETLEQVLRAKGIEEVLRRAVFGMIPSNKLRKGMMKKLEIKD